MRLCQYPLRSTVRESFLFILKKKERNDIQKEAYEAWLASNKKGTLEMATGTGKTIASLHCLYSMPKNDGKVHLFLAETVERERDLLKDILLYNKLFDVNVFQDYNLKFKCYQTVYKYEDYNFGLVIADEIHMSLSPQYSQFYYNNTYDAIVGLSATVDRKTSYEVNDKVFTKGQLLDEIAPVCYTYTIQEAKNHSIGRNLNIYIIKQSLDEVNKNILSGNSKKRFYQTEKAVYDFWDKEHKKSWFITDRDTRDLKIRITSTKRSNLLFNLPSKIETVNKLLPFLKGKTILFGNSLDSLLKITPNVISSRYSDDENKAIRDRFEKNSINLIGSFKKLRQGANLEGLDNCIIMSYFSSEVHIIQQLGRLRKNEDKLGNVFILLTKGTQEEVWFSKMMQNIDDFNIIYCEDIKDCIIKYSKNNA